MNKFILVPTNYSVLLGEFIHFYFMIILFISYSGKEQICFITSPFTIKTRRSSIMAEDYLYVPVQYANFDDGKPVRIVCPSCDGHVLTTVEAKRGIRTWIASLIICWMGCCCGCCLIPCCIKSLQDFKHFCPRCKALVGKNRSGSL